ncbi:2OG-Fe(II) oxygenase family protein [bacterium SCSIO 12741]|nr:2OG-Fe(II) oxygenase family protein [bacterium SCSIO 12741]
MNKFPHLSPSTPFVLLDGLLLNPEPFKMVLKEWVSLPQSYRLQWLQKRYSYGYDGYSFPGQEDSLNQGYEDALHSMVISSETRREEFPKEFQEVLNRHWDGLIGKVAEGLASKIDSFDSREWGYSLSCNYFPAQAKRDTPLRLDEHPDGSFLTILPFGSDGGLEYEEDGDWKRIPAGSSPVAFNGYFSEYLNPDLKALNHRVPWKSEEEKERFSFALFVLPKKESEWEKMNLFNRYLGLYD